MAWAKLLKAERRMDRLDTTTEGDHRFIGRIQELTTLRDALEEAHAGLAPIVVVHGEAGIGKTRTVAEFARSERANAVAVLWGTVYQGGVRQPYAPWIEALATNSGGRWSADTRGRHPSVPAGLAALLDVDVSRGSGAELVSDGARLQLFEAVVRDFDEADETRVLVLDDLQWADPDTLELLSYIARTGLPHTLMVLVYQGSALPIEHAFSRVLAHIGRGRTRPIEDVVVQSLQPEEAAELLSEVTRRVLEPPLAEAVLREGHGNPFFITEIGRELRRHGELVGIGTVNWRPPTSIRQAVGLRLAALSAETRNLLELASVFTSVFEFEDLAAVSEVAEEVLLDSLDEALEAELLRSLEAGRYAFCQALVRQTLYDRFSPNRRARLHRKVASVIEQRHDGNLDEVAAELAGHYYESRILPGAAGGLPYALAAADQWRVANAPRRAAVFLAQALDLAPEEDAAARADIAAQLAVAQAEAALFDEAPRSLDAALTMLEKCDAPPEAIAEVVYRTISTLQDAMADQDTLEPGIQRGLAARGKTRDLAWARLKLLERPRRPIAAGSIETHGWLGFDPDAVDLARREGDELDYARSLEHLDPWQPEELLSAAEKIRGWSDPRAQLRGLDIIAQCLSCLHGVVPGTAAVVADFRALADRFGALPARSLGLVYDGAMRGAQGNLQLATNALSSAQELAELVPQTGRLRTAIALVTALTSRNLDPDWPTLAMQMNQHARRPEQVLWFRLALAAFAGLAFVEAGRHAEGSEVLREITPGIERSAPWDYGQNCAVCLAGEAAATLGDAGLAADLLPSCLRLIEQKVGDYYMTSAQLTAARLLRVLGQREDALRRVGAARAKAQAQDQRPLLAIIDYEEADMTLDGRRGHRSDRLTVVRERFEELGMHEWVRRTTSTQSPAAGLPDRLTQREADVLRRVAAGRTNREIAADLVISVHTVERHIHNAYQKISVRNRADATAYVIRHGL
jgi:DNA-binding CsgD family transcriptional regulator